MRHFRAALESVPRTGEPIRIERHGEVVAEPRPVVEPKQRPSSTVLAKLLRDRPPDPEFADDLERMHDELSREPLRVPGLRVVVA